MARQTIQNSNASLYLDGIAGYFTIPITPDPTGFSFGMWVNTARKTPSSTSVFISSNSGSFTDGVMLLRNTTQTNKIQFLGYNSTNIMFTVGGVALEKTWVHFAATYLPSGTCKAYINGELVETVTATGSIATGTTSIYFGRRANTAVFAGMNANQLVWHNTTTPWTAQQVQDLYNKGTVPTGATAVYPLSEGAGTVAYDTSGNGNNGTITSGTWTRDTPTKTRKLVNNNLVYNGDFEIAPVVNVPTTTGGRWIDGTAGGSTTNNVFGWMYYNWTGTYGANFDTSVKRTGNASIKISTLATGSTIGVGVNADTASSWAINNIPVLPSTSYTVSVWMKTRANSGTATTGARCIIQEFNGTGITSVTTTNVVTGVITTTDWTQYTSTFTTNSATRYINPKFNINGNDGAATLIMDAWFDDIQLYPTTPVTRNALTFARQPVDELVRNGDFEYAPAFTAATTTSGRWIDGTAGGSSTNVYGWYTNFAGTGAIQFDSTVRDSGSNSLKVSTTAINSIAYALTTEIGLNSGASYYSLLPSTSYTLTFRMKTSLVSGTSRVAFVRHTQYTGAKASSTGTDSTYVNTTTDWTTYTISFTTEATTRFGHTRCYVWGQEGAATLIMDAYFDNISLKLTTPVGRSAA